LGPPAQAPPHRGFCPGGRSPWLGEIAEFETGKAWSIAFGVKIDDQS